MHEIPYNRMRQKQSKHKDGKSSTLNCGKGAHSPHPSRPGQAADATLTYHDRRSVYTPRDVPAGFLKWKSRGKISILYDGIIIRRLLPRKVPLVRLYLQPTCLSLSCAAQSAVAFPFRLRHDRRHVPRQALSQAPWQVLPR